MSNSLQANISQPVAGLGDFTFTIVTAGIYTVQVKTTLPLASAVSIVIKKNSSALVTVGGADANPTPTQQSIGASTSAAFAAADVVHVVLASSAVADNVPNNVKSIVNIFLGE